MTSEHSTYLAIELSNIGRCDRTYALTEDGELQVGVLALLLLDEKVFHLT